MNKEVYSISQLIRIGFFVGIGFAFPLTVMNYVPLYFLGNFMVAGFGEEFEEFADFSPTESGLEAKILKSNQGVDGWVFLGSLTNTGDDKWESATVQIELFDEEGNFIDETDGYVEGAIDPGTSHNFKVDFYSYDDDEPVVFSDFKISVTSAY